jgi:methylated-DNA-[protein]-cysteine S-methyltransferase
MSEYSLKLIIEQEFVEQDDKVLKETRKQLDEYFDRYRKKFDIPLLMVGTDFQKSAWNALIEVPYETVEFKEFF